MDTLTALSSLTSGLSSFGEAASYFGQASALNNNAELLDIQGQGVIASGDYTARRQREQGDKFMSRVTAQYAKAGVKFEGSPALVWAESEKNIRMDILATKLNAANKANAIGFEALNQRIAAGQARTDAVRKISEGLVKITTTAAMSGASGGGSSSVAATRANTSGLKFSSGSSISNTGRF